MILKHRDREVLHFAWCEPQGVRVLSVNEANRRFLPLDMHGEATDASLWQWLARRTVPMNRHGVAQMMARLGIQARDTRAVIEVCKGLSLNDVHWVVDDAFKGSWAACNLYDNPFSKTLAVMAFTGEGEFRNGDVTTSPEFTTNGMLAKCWRRVDDRVLLYKSGTEGAANTGFEPYSEFYAAQVAQALGLPHVPYGLQKFKRRLCSTCPLFTSDKYGYLPAGRLVTQEEALADERFADIFFFDALIFNTDRHLGNFGYLIDNDTNEIAGAAPIFDNGYGLFSLALYKPGGRYDEFHDLRTFVNHVSPTLYPNWLGFPGGVTPRMRGMLEPLKGFRFTPDRYYNLPLARLRAIEDFVQKRVHAILDFGDEADELIKIKKKSFTVNHVNSSSGLLQLKENLKADPFITLDELAELMSVSRVTVSHWLAKLKEQGEIRRVGAPKNGYWEVMKAVVAP